VRSYAWDGADGKAWLINEACSPSGRSERRCASSTRRSPTQIAMVHILLPYMILAIANALRQIDPSLARASSGLGARRGEPSRRDPAALHAGCPLAGVCWSSCWRSASTSRRHGRRPREITLSMLIAQQVDQLNWAYAGDIVPPSCWRLPWRSSPPAIACPASAMPSDERAMTGMRMIGARLLPTTVVGLILLSLPFPSSSWSWLSFSSATYLTFRRRPSVGAGTAPISAARTGCGPPGSAFGRRCDRRAGDACSHAWRRWASPACHGRCASWRPG